MVATTNSDLVCVDRSIRPTYPDGMTGLLHPELECVGPAEFDLAKIELWLHDGQKNGGMVNGREIYDHLKETDGLKSCLNLQTALAIQAKEIECFRKFFGNKVVYFWQSVVRDSDGDLSVPYLYDRGDEVVLNWDWLDDDWLDRESAARFAE